MRKPSPALLVSLVALFFALGGTAFAFGEKAAPHKGADGGWWVTMGGSNTGAPGPWQFQSNIPFTIVLM